jgi:16S rRNA (adenine1518-N6/adenine1519-N6)-dimethyltransferase
MSSFNFKKKFGQNFLQDNSIIYKIVDGIGAAKDDLVIEIGPGGGA